jgi:hypothetical protein
MRRWLCVATFSFLVLALPLCAQRRGGGGGAHFASVGRSAPHSSGSFRSGGMNHGSGVRFRTGNPSFRRPGFRRPFFYYPYAGYYPYDGLYSDSSDYQGDYSTADSYASYNQVPYREDSELQRDVQTLNGKIDRLQADVEARNRPKPDLEPATALVFRDQHVEEVRNYAISGGTLWVLNEQAAKKIPLAKLDLDATVRMNDDRGVDFQIPK